MSKKRANGEGSIRKRKDGRWEGRYTAGNDLQVLMDLSEPLFRDPIIVMSKTLQVLACTRHIHVAHPDVEKTLQDGFSREIWSRV